MNEGFPPGWDIKRGTRPAGPSSKDKQNETIGKLHKQMGMGGIEGEPVYNDDFLEEEFQPPPQQPPRRMQQAAQGQQSGREAASTQRPQQRAAQPAHHAPQQQYEEPIGLNPNIEAAKKQHPVIQKMLDKFGLKKSKIYDLFIETKDGTKFTYSMSIVPDELSLWALEEAQTKSMKSGSGSGPAIAWFQTLMACASVVAIDGSPAWEVFNVRIDNKEADRLANDPLSPNMRIRKATALPLAELLWSEMQPVVDKLWDFYEKKVVKESAITSSFDKEMEGAFKYVCPIDGCSEYLIKKPTYDGDVELPYYCTVHGVELIKTVDLASELNAPLE